MSRNNDHHQASVPGTAEVLDLACRPQSNILKTLTKQFFTYYTHSVFPLYLHYATRLATFLTTILEHFNH